MKISLKTYEIELVFSEKSKAMWIGKGEEALEILGTVGVSQTLCISN